MILPPNLSVGGFYMDPFAVSTDHELSYLLSFESTNISEKAIHYSPKDIYSSPLQSFNSVNFTPEAYNTLLKQTEADLTNKTHDIAKALRSGFKEYFLRVANKTLNACLSYENYDFMAQYDDVLNKNEIINLMSNDYKIQSMKGSLPFKWPEGLKDFLTQLKKIPILAFYNEAQPILEEFIIKIQKAIEGLLRFQKKPDFLDTLFLQLEALIGVVIRTGNYTQILSSIQFIISIEKKLTEQENLKVSSKLSKYILQLMNQIDGVQKQPKLHYQRSACDLGAFEIMKKLHFQRHTFYNNTLATDGQYLYLYISAINGGMFKIGTGENSIPGKVYLYQPVNLGKADDVSWVYLKGKLYLRTSSKQPRNLEIVDPETFKIQSSIQLHCPPIFGHISMQNINKNYPLLTDGQHLYFIGKRLSIEKIQSKKQEKDKQEELPPVPSATSQPESEKDRRRRERAQRKKKKGPQENVLRLLQYVLYEYDVTNGESKDQTQESFDKQLTQQLYQSFNGYFTHNQCSRALSLHKEDLASAAQWLVDEGQKERSKRTYTVSNSVVLAQVQVTNDAHTKALRSSADILVKEDSILQVHQISDCIWTCSKDNVACYTETGIKVFGKHQNQFKNIHIRKDKSSEQQRENREKQPLTKQNQKEFHKEQKQQRQSQKKYKLKGTYISTIQLAGKKFNKQPQYLIVYDNINRKYYTFLWTDYQHSFPATITVSRDYLEYQDQIVRERPDNLLSVKETKSLSDIGVTLVHKLCLMQEFKLRLPWRPNNWLYTYSCIIMDLNSKIKESKDDGDSKKKLANKRSKIVAKINKILEISNLHQKQKLLLKSFKTSIRQIKPEYAFTTNGRIQTLKLINRVFSDKLEHQSVYFYLMELWVINAQVVQIHNKDYLLQLGTKLLNKLKSLNTGDSYDNLLRVLIKGFYIFFNTNESQLQFLLHLQGIQLVDLSITHFAQFSTRLGLKQSNIEELQEDQIPDKYDYSTNFENIYQKKNYVDLTHQKQAENIGYILLDFQQQVPSKDQKTTILQMNKKNVSFGNAKIKQLRQAFMNKILKGLQNGSEEILNIYKAIIYKAVELAHDNLDAIDRLTLQTLNIIQQTLPKISLKNQGGILRLLSFITQIYFALPGVFYPSVDIQQPLLNIIQSLLRPEILPVLNSINIYKLEGISQTLQKTFQTNHPYERGKTQAFETQNFTNAICVTVQFDKRCQSDPNHDVLSIYASSLNPVPTAPQREANNSNDKFNTHLKMSGKQHNKAPYLLLGSSISMDFISSGHAKDEHSLNRFGFKFGLRPVYSGKIQYERSDLEEVISKFGSKQAFQQYVFVIKLLTVVASSMSENMLLQKEVENQNNLTEYLQGKIFRQGLEQCIPDTRNSQERRLIINNFLKKQHKDKFNCIAKEIYLQNYKLQDLKKEPVLPRDQIQQTCWNLNDIPQYLKKQIQEIKNLDGNFINLFMEARSQVKNSGSYAIQTKRKAFTEEYKNLWLKGQALLFLTVLKHSGLLHLSLKFSIQYIKENLQAFEQARNSVFNSFIFRMQLEKEWQDLLATYHNPEEQQKQQQIQEEKQLQKEQKKEKKPSVVIKKAGKKIAVKLQPGKKQQVPKEIVEKKVKKVKINPEVVIRERLTDAFRVGQICKYKNIPFVQDDNYVNVTQIIDKLKVQKPSNRSVYEAPAFNLIRSCLFLLKLRSPNSTLENPSAQLSQLKPLGVYRSFSEGVDEKKINKDKVVVFREWLQNWKKWKGFKKQEKVQLRFPVREIVGFIIGWINQNEMQDLIIQRHRRTNRRIDMINFCNSITKVVRGTLFEKYILGTSLSNLKDGPLTNTDGTNQQLRKNLQLAVSEYQSTLQNIYEYRQKKLPITLASFQAEVQRGTAMIPRIKSIAMNNLLLYCDMINPPLTMALFYSAFRMVSNSNQQLIQLSNRIICKALLSKPSPQHLVSSLWKQVGKDTLSIRRWKDPIFIERLVFLLIKAEVLAKQNKITFQQKTSLATVLFYICYHVESSLVNKTTLRIIKSMNISARTELQTPFQIKYIQFKDVPNGRNCIKLQSSPFEFKQKKELNNWQLLTERVGQNTFRKPQPILDTLIEKKKLGTDYHLLLHLSNQEDIAWIVRVLYYVQQFYPTVKQIQSWEDYIAEKNKKDENKNLKKQPIASDSKAEPKIIEKIFSNCPTQNLNIEPEVQEQLPIGWFLTYNNCFSKYHISRDPFKKSQNSIPRISKKTNQRKNWQCPNLNILLKKFEQLTSKPLEQPKQNDSIEDKKQFVAAKNFITKMRKLTVDAQALHMNLMNHGYVVFAQYLPHEKINIICELFELGKTNKLHPIKVDLTKKDYKTRLTPNEPNAPASSEISLSILQSEFQNVFQYLVDFNNECSGRQNHLAEVNKGEVVLDDCQLLDWTEMIQIDDATTPQMKIGKQLVETGWFQQRRRMDQVKMTGYEDSLYTIIQGGIQSGIKKATIVLNSDSVLTTQQVGLQTLVANTVQFLPDDQQQILNRLSSNGIDLPPVVKTQDLIPYMQLKMLLQKASEINWSNYQNDDLKQVTNKLITLSKNKIKQKKTVKQNQEELMRLMLKLFDSDVNSLDVIKFYQAPQTFNPKLQKYILHTTAKKDVIDLNQGGESHQNYFLQNPQYVRSVESQPPPVEENKLLKYWEKNIIPKIHQFVKTTLKPLQIDEFFQQMRIPLRKNDQNQAAKVAYVICDNKLPPGAVLPDASHDWSTLSIEEVSIKQYVLLKLPKSLNQTSTPLLQAKFPQQLCLVQIVFIDPKNNSLLVRHRLSEYSVVNYFWVSITSVLPVQTPIKFLNIGQVLKNSQQSLKGLICGYAKQVLTKMSQVVEIDVVELIKENILDMFVDDPVSGWLNNASEWPIQKLIQKMLSDGNNKLIDYIQQNLQPLKAYQTNLFSNQLKSLSQFTNNTSLIVSFQKKAKLGLCTGIRFYNDEMAVNQIDHIYSGNKVQKSYFQPIIFKHPKVYSRYYNNLENLTAQDQGGVAAGDIPVLVIGVSPIWTISGFLADKISEIGFKNSTHTEQIKRLIKVFVDWILKPGSFILIGIAAQLVTRMTKRLIYIYTLQKKAITFDSLGITQGDVQKIKNLIKEMQQVQSKDAIVVLYEDYLQNMTEMLASFLSNIKINLEIPEFIKAVIQTQNLNEYIRGQPCSTPIIDNDMSAQWERFLLIERLPPSILGEEIRKKVIEIIAENKGRILTPYLDVYYENESLIAIVDGWDVVDLVEEEVIQKIQEQEEKQPEEQVNLMTWTCAVCTYQNPAGNATCDMCQSPAPVAQVKQTLEKVKEVDLNQAATRLKEKQAKRFEIVKQKIKQFVDCYWKKQIQNIKKQNLQIQEKNKQKELERKKREERESKRKKDKKQNKIFKQQEPLDLNIVPEAVECKISTGSQVLKHSITEKFFQRRLTPCDSNKFILSLLDNSITSNVEKFKFLEKKGIDLWGVKVIDPNATLLSYELLVQLMRYVQTQICKQTSSVLSYNPNSIRLISQCHNLFQSDKEVPINFRVESDTGTIIKFKRLAQCKPCDIRFSWYIIKSYNNWLSQSLPFIKMNKCNTSELQKINIQKLSIDAPLGQKVCTLRQLIMCSIKSELLQKVMQKTSISRDQVPKIVIERLKIKEGEKSSILSAKQKDQFILSRAYEQIKTISPTQFRPFKPKGAEPYLAFEITFKGQNVQGQGGPYRQFFTDISNQLHPSRHMGLLIPTPNNLHQTGEARSKHILNPKATNSYQLGLFEFIGMLMGCSIRTGAHLALDLPSMVWKQLVGQNVYPSDLIEVDEKFYEMTKQILECPSEQQFQQIDEVSGEPLYWLATFSDGSDLQLIKNGSTTKVLYKQRQKYVSKLLETRLKQSILQIKSIRKGLSTIIPEPFLNTLSGEDLEIYVCGRAKVDVLLLKRHTKYSGQFTQESQLIKMFWSVLLEMTEPERLKFIKFCWGQERLPINSEEFQRNNIRFMIKPQLLNVVNPDHALPRADTCFFNIQLPKYSTKEIMRQRIIVAINTDSDSMNAEELREDNPLIYAPEDSSYDGEEGGGGG